MHSQERLTFLEDKVLLVISSLGLILVTTAVFWVVRQSPDWGRHGRVQQADEEGEAGLLGGRTRTVPGGRAALKAARKEAKKRAKAEFKESSAGQKRRSRAPEKKRPTLERSQEATSRESAAEALRRLESYILDNKVSSLEDLEAELGIPSAEIATKIEELETRGVFKGIMIEDSRGSGKSRGPSFVRLQDEQIRALAALINERGRLSVAEVAAEANRVLQLSGWGEEAQKTAGGKSDSSEAAASDCCGEGLGASAAEAPSDGDQTSAERHESSNYDKSCSQSSGHGSRTAVVGPSLDGEGSDSRTRS